MQNSNTPNQDLANTPFRNPEFIKEARQQAQQTSTGIPGDEFKAIPPIAKVREAIAAARQYGVVTVMGVSSTEQLEQALSEEDAAAAADSIRANMNNKISITRTKGDRVRYEGLLPPNVLAALDNYAKKNGWSRSKAIALAVALLPGIEIEGQHETLQEVAGSGVAHGAKRLFSLTSEDLQGTLTKGPMGAGMSAWNLFNELTPQDTAGANSSK